MYVGLDYHQGSVQVCVLDAEKRQLVNRRVGNDWREIVSAVGALGAVGLEGMRVEAAVEACCGSASLAEELVERAGWSVSLAHPGYVKRMKGSPDKSDYSDAKMLADLVRVGYLPQVWLAPAALRELRELTRYRQQLVDERRRVKQRVGALLRSHRVCRPAGVNAWTKAWVAWLKETDGLGEQSRWVMDRHLAEVRHLDEGIARVGRRLRSVTKGDRQVERLMDQPGIGPVTAWVLRAEIGRFDRFASGKQLARYCGLSPRNDSSGERQAESGLVKAGNKQLRTVVIEAAHRLRRGQGQWGSMSRSLEARGKKGSVIAAAVANRWVRQLYWRMRELAAAA